ncbi:hypothetical protein CPB85DRAFT_528815 [Mucidula mucida]|nr:hypothetical protein CPB85DRAFT_528815 [Mucidula mucida]
MFDHVICNLDLNHHHRRRRQRCQCLNNATWLLPRSRCRIRNPHCPDRINLLLHPTTAGLRLVPTPFTRTCCIYCIDRGDGKRFHACREMQSLASLLVRIVAWLIDTARRAVASRKRTTLLILIRLSKILIQSPSSSFMHLPLTLYVSHFRPEETSLELHIFVPSFFSDLLLFRYGGT